MEKAELRVDGAGPGEEPRQTGCGFQGAGPSAAGSAPRRYRPSARWASFRSRRACCWRLSRHERSSAAARVLRKAAVDGREMAARGSRRRALRLLLVVQLLAGRWRPAGAARGARGGELGRGRGPRGRAAGLRRLALSSGVRVRISKLAPSSVHLDAKKRPVWGLGGSRRWGGWCRVCLGTTFSLERAAVIGLPASLMVHGVETRGLMVFETL